MTESRTPRPLVFLLDVDNTLLNNDALKADLGVRVQELAGAERTRGFWRLYEDIREKYGYVDLPATVREWALKFDDPTMGERLDDVLISIDFRHYLYPHVLETVAYLESLGTVTILSDGDRVFQALKIRNSGLTEAVGGRVVISVHKEAELAAVFAAYPADHYVMVDDRPRILAALEQECPATFTTVLVLQGEHAVQSEYEPAPDFVVPDIAELRRFTLTDFLLPARIADA